MVFFKSQYIKITSSFEGKNLHLGEYLYELLHICKNLVSFTFHSVKGVQILSFNGTHFPAFRLNTEINCKSLYSVRIQEN